MTSPNGTARFKAVYQSNYGGTKILSREASRLLVTRVTSRRTVMSERTHNVY
jgi:hypothetical protein